MPRFRPTRFVALLALALTFGVLQPLVSSVEAAPPTPQTRSFTAPIDSLGGYEGQTICDPIARPGVNATKSLLLKTYGDRVIYIPRYGCSGTSEHHEGRALDWMINSRNSSQKATADSFVNWMLKTDQFGNRNAMVARMGVMYIIWNNKMWRAYDPGRGWTEYKNCSTRTSTGNDTECHRDHVHISFTWDGAMGKTSFYTGTPLVSGGACGPIGATSTTSPPATDQQFVPLNPARLVDSAKGIGVADAQRCRLSTDGYAGQGRRMDVQVAGRAGVPATGASAVALSVRVGTNAPTSVYAWPAGSTKPSTVQVSAGPGADGRATVVVPLGAGGRISLATTLGAQWVNADVLGYYTARNGMLFTPLNPWRAVEPFVLAGGASRSFRIGGLRGVPTSGVGALALSVTTLKATTSSGLRIKPVGGIEPGADSAVFRMGVTRTASVITRATDNGSITVTNRAATGSVTVAIDVNGWFGADGLSYASSRGGRVLDTRSGLGASGRIGTGRIITFPVRGIAGVPTGVRAVALQLTAVTPSVVTATTVWSSGGELPNGRSFTTDAVTNTSQYVVAPLGSDGRVALRGSGSSSHYMASVVGWWLPTSRTGSVTPTTPPTTPPGTTPPTTSPGTTPPTVPVAPSAYSLSTGVNPGLILLPSRATVSGAVLPASASKGKRVVIQRWISREWKDVASTTVASNGRFSYTASPTLRGNYVYRVWKPSDGCTTSGCITRGATSGPLKLDAVSRYAVGIGVLDPTVTKGSLVSIQGNVSPVYAGSRVLVQRYTGGSWKTLGSSSVRSSGRYTYVTRPSGVGGFVYRTWKPSDQCVSGLCLLRANGSRTVNVSVR